MKEHLQKCIDEASRLYHRLVVVVGPHGSGKTRVLRELAATKGYPFVNVSLELSKQLKNIPPRKRALEIYPVMEDMLNPTGEVVLLDNIELLFEPTLQLRPLDLLKRLSRNRTLVVAWPGEKKKETLIHAQPGHPEYVQEPIDGFHVIEITQRMQSSGA